MSCHGVSLNTSPWGSPGETERLSRPLERLSFLSPLPLRVPSPPYQKHHPAAECSTIKGPFYALKKTIGPRELSYKSYINFNAHFMGREKKAFISLMREKKRHCLTFSNFFNVSGLIVDIWILISVPLLCTIWLYNIILYYIHPITVYCFFELYKENLVSQGYVVGKGGRILIVFPHTRACSY